MSSILSTDLPQEARRAHFDWAVYSDATLAGLSILLPIPLLDSIFENFFRRRMVTTIVARHQEIVSPEAIRLLQQDSTDLLSKLRGCVLWPLRFISELILSLSRKIFYFLAVKRAVEALATYWQRAYLLDYVVRRGYLSAPPHELAAIQTLERVLSEFDASPLTTLAADLVMGPWRTWRLLRDARQNRDKQELNETRIKMADNWSKYSEYFSRLAVRFEELYQTHNR